MYLYTYLVEQDYKYIFNTYKNNVQCSQKNLKNI
jgi:hypothetical protein